ncbi:MAG TPA: ABC transporter permease [Acidimicrobiales bacterium]|nr:ABC transporter permease [Acidimicrobiales bacterium]
MLSGHRLEDVDQVVFGAITLAQLHKQVGDTVSVSSGTGAATQLRIVGTATMPTIGGPGPHLEMGTGAVLPDNLIPAALKNPFNDPTPGPESVFVNLRPGANRAAAQRSLQQIAQATSNTFNFGVFVGPVLRPAEIVNYRSLGTTPALLGAALALGAVIALTLALVASVRRRRRELAVLRTLGFTARQLAATAAWQSSVAVLLGTIVGLPVGVALGRALWDLFAGEIHAVPSPTVPGMWLVLIGVAAIVLANVVAAVPGRIAARTPAVGFLRAE